MKKSIVAGLALLAIGAAACQPTKPPPPPPTPPNVDVLLVGDSVGFGVGCMLGDNGPDNVPCPPKPGFTTFNGYLGACAVAEGDILLYNPPAVDPITGQPVPRVVEGNCNASGADASTLWPQAVAALDPELVVIVTGGWEIVHRWSSLPPSCDRFDAVSIFLCSPPERQMGSTNGTLNANAINNYKNEMKAVINAMRATPQAPKVLLLNSPYVAPTAADPSGSWYEAYPQGKPPNWQSPNQQTPYIPSKTKVDRFNEAVLAVVNELNQPSNVELFDFWVEFSPVINGDQEFSFNLCTYPQNKVNPANCPPGFPPFQARLSDAGHLTTAGNDMLGQAMLSTVYEMLGIPEP